MDEEQRTRWIGIAKLMQAEGVKYLQTARPQSAQEAIAMIEAGIRRERAVPPDSRVPKCCASCKYSCPAEVASAKHVLECHRRPCRPYCKDGIYRAQWPQVRSDDWCGEYEKIENWTP
jgi:hypothetical protein